MSQLPETPRIPIAVALFFAEREVNRFIVDGEITHHMQRQREYWTAEAIEKRADEREEARHKRLGYE